MCLIEGGSKDISDAIKRILPRIMTKAVQLRYSSCGWQSGSKKKDSFAETKTYKIMRGMHFIVCVTNFKNNFKITLIVKCIGIFELYL